MDCINHAAGAMSNYERAIDVISGNMGNMQTPGYHAHRMTFQVSSHGVVTSRTDVLPVNGPLEATRVPTDMAIQGDGYFVVQDGSTQSYTRDGSFHVDAGGRLQFGSRNLPVLGYGASGGVVNASGGLVPLVLPVGASSAAQASTRVSLAGNLDASAAIYVPGSGSTAESGGVARVTTHVLDSLGVSHEVDLVLKKVASGTWSWEASVPAADGSVLHGATGQITFGSDGKATSGSPQFTIDPPGGAQAGQALTLDVSALAQLAGSSTVSGQGDGSAPSTLTSFTVGPDGTVTGTYGTGATQVLGQVVLAHFSNPAGLTQLDGNLLAATADSGMAHVGAPGTGSLGSIQQGSLEGSSVSITEEFARLMLAQRGYEANSRLLQTGNQMWQTLMQMQG